ncbi:aldo/keto reductase [Arthrobacter sp. 35W]|uniref:aldo/keto reductase n=1 Tax=Arthrobacter sp. 35W TaxID=1132441 RepID=UPI000412CA34
METAGELIYGCMGLGGPWDATEYGAAEIDGAAAAIGAARRIGITVFDHADIYGGGKSEAVFGDVLARNEGLRGQIRIQTKCGIRLGEGGLDAYYDLSREAILERTAASLARLRTDYVDLLILHRPDPLMDPGEVAAALTFLHAEGMIGGVGVSNMSGAQIALLQDRLELPIEANQLEMSLRQRAWLESGVLINHPEAAQYPFPHGTLEHCRRHGVGLQAWGALGQGVYSGAPGEATDAERATAELVAALAGQKGTTPEAIVLGWLMRHPAGISPVIGSTNPDRIAACADAPEQARLMATTEWYSLYLSARGGPIP